MAFRPSVFRLAVSYPLSCVRGSHQGLRYEDRPSPCGGCGIWTWPHRLASYIGTSREGEVTDDR